jgi:hypothetical protein
MMIVYNDDDLQPERQKPILEESVLVVAGMLGSLSFVATTMIAQHEDLRVESTGGFCTTRRSHQCDHNKQKRRLGSFDIDTGARQDGSQFMTHPGFEIGRFPFLRSTIEPFLYPIFRNIKKRRLA